MADNGGGREVGLYFHQGNTSCLPWQVVHGRHEALHTTKEYETGRAAPPPPVHHNRPSYDDQLHSQKSQGSNSLLPPHHTRKPKGVKNWVSRGHGMQAVFLDSTRKPCCGTGVFLPQSAGVNFPSKKKPACARVLLPNRVIQALNLNVHELGLHISPKNRHRKRFRSYQEDDKEDEECYSTTLDNQSNSSSELCLPNEWTY